MNPEISQRLRQRLEQEYGDIPDKTFEAYVRELWDIPLERIAQAFPLAKKYYKGIPTAHQFKALCTEPAPPISRTVGQDYLTGPIREILK